MAVFAGDGVGVVGVGLYGVVAVDALLWCECVSGCACDLCAVAVDAVCECLWDFFPEDADGACFVCCGFDGFGWGWCVLEVVLGVEEEGTGEWEWDHCVLRGLV